jgi:hypothetical protein
MCSGRQDDGYSSFTGTRTCLKTDGTNEACTNLMFLNPLDIYNSWYLTVGGFGGLVVSMLASGTQDRGFAPGEKIISMPSFVREVKPFAPCRIFVACQRTL